MNAEALLAQYERIAEAPDAIARLRRFVLDLAVRGKLVPQDPTEEATAVALRRNKAIGSSEGAFALPPSWLWVSVAAVARSRLGKMLDKAKNKGTPRPYLRNINVRWFGFDLSDLQEMPFEDEELEEFALRRGDVLICEGGEPGRTAVWRGVMEGVYFQKAIHRVRFVDAVDPDFFVLAIRASANDGRLAESFTGTGIKHFTGKGLDAYRFPLPPVAEQHRIVAKVDELMALCDRLEAARTAREATRDRLAAASLARLNTPDPETFPSDARFALAALPALTTRPDQIKHLRQTILNLAVRGKLVPQDARDEPAAALIARIAQHWKKQGVSHRREAAEVCNSPPQEALPYSAPPSWGWLRAEALAQPGHTITYGILKPEWVEDGIPTVRVSEMKTGSIDVAALPRCDPKRAAKFAKTTLMEGDLLISKDGTIGKTAFVPAALAGGNITQHVLRFSVTPEINSHFVKLVIDGPAYQAQLAGETKGVALQGVNVGDFRQMALPVPPLAEQHRIVAKVSELMTLCDALEASLAAATTTRTRLLDATLAEALVPAVATQDIAA